MGRYIITDAIGRVYIQEGSCDLSALHKLLFITTDVKFPVDICVSIKKTERRDAFAMETHDTLHNLLVPAG
jgi:hypothetical protein